MVYVGAYLTLVCFSVHSGIYNFSIMYALIKVVAIQYTIDFLTFNL